MSPVVELHNPRPFSYRTLRTQEDPGTRTSWMYMHAERANDGNRRRPCFTLDLMKDMRDYLAGVGQRSQQTAIDGREPGLDHLVVTSDASAFNLGGGPENAVSLRGLIAHIDRLLGRATDLQFEDWRAGD